MRLGLPHPSIASIPQCVCTHPINLMDIHLLCCTHSNKCTRTHDVIHNTFVAIAQDVGFHVGQKQLYVFPSTMFNSFHQRSNIVITKTGICTLINITIIDPTRADLLLQFCATTRFVTFDVTQTKKRNIMIDTPLINSSLKQLRYLDVYTNKLMCFHMILSMPFEA